LSLGKRSTETTERTDDERDAETGAILGAAIHVHLALGPGFLEAVYQAALAVEFRRRGLPFQREVLLPVCYEGEWLDAYYRVDFMCQGVMVELKALAGLTGVEESQVLNYLKAKGGGRALLLNFGAGRLEIRRYIR
jgi:GxxExxY protein